jgi:transcriptional regulator with XRE-family HTH domain
MPADFTSAGTFYGLGGSTAHTSCVACAINPDHRPGMDEGIRFGQRLRSIRRAHRISQEELAERAGRSVEAVSNLERGLNLPSFETLEQLARALGIPIRNFFELPEGDQERSDLVAEIMAAARALPTADLRVAAIQISALHNRPSDR